METFQDIIYQENTEYENNPNLYFENYLKDKDFKKFSKLISCDDYGKRKLIINDLCDYSWMEINNILDLIKGKTVYTKKRGKIYFTGFNKCIPRILKKMIENMINASDNIENKKFLKSVCARCHCKIKNKNKNKNIFD